MTDEYQNEINNRAVMVSFLKDAADISAAGDKTYGKDWKDSVDVLNAVGLNGPDFVANVMDVAGREKTHHVMHAIARDVDRATELSRMNPIKRVAAVSKIADGLDDSGTRKATPQPKPMTRFDDRLSDAEFNEQFRDHIKDRHRWR